MRIRTKTTKTQSSEKVTRVKWTDGQGNTHVKMTTSRKRPAPSTSTSTFDSKPPKAKSNPGIKKGVKVAAGVAVAGAAGYGTYKGVQAIRNRRNNKTGTRTANPAQMKVKNRVGTKSNQPFNKTVKNRRR